MNSCPVDESSVNVCFECPNVRVSTGARPIGAVDNAGVASAGLKRDDVKTESNEYTNSCEPVDVSCESNLCAKSGGSVKCECLDTSLLATSSSDQIELT